MPILSTQTKLLLAVFSAFVESPTALVPADRVARSLGLCEVEALSLIDQLVNDGLLRKVGTPGVLSDIRLLLTARGALAATRPAQPTAGLEVH